MNALVTGVAGFIGSHLAEALIGGGHKVIGVDCFTDYYERSRKEANLLSLMGHSSFKFTEIDLMETDLATLVAGVTHVFHLAAQPGVRHSWKRGFRAYTARNLDATQGLLEACAEQPVERFIYASSSSVYGDHAALPMREDASPLPVSPYGVTKLAAELLCRLYHETSGVPVVVLRYFTVYGPRQRPDMAFHRFLLAAIRGKPIYVNGDGRQTRDFTFVSDTVTATVAAGTHGTVGRIYNVGGGSQVSVSDALEIVAACAGRPLDIQSKPSQRGDMRDTYADTSLAQRDLGFTPTIGLTEGLRAEHEWLSQLSTVDP